MLQRACRRRHKLLIEANRCWRRIIALGRWAFPDTWNALRGSRPAILAVLRRWPHLDALGRARVTSIADEIACHSRAVGDVTARATRVRDTARAWAAFWDGKRLDSENVHVMHIDDGRITSFRSFDWDQQAAREFWD